MGRKENDRKQRSRSPLDTTRNHHPITMEALEAQKAEICAFISKEICKCASEKSMVEEIQQLRKALQIKDNKIADLQRRVEDLKQYSRKDDMIITGVKIRRSYADVTANGDGTRNAADNVQSVEEQVLTHLETHNIEILPEEISACHTLGRPDKDGKHTVIVRFASRKSKTVTMEEG